MYHQDRITVIKKTWQKYTKNVLYFSEELGKFRAFDINLGLMSKLLTRNQEGAAILGS